MNNENNKSKRVFFVDVGNLPAEQAKEYLKQAKDTRLSKNSDIPTQNEE
jgi:hypothetical protein